MRKGHASASQTSMPPMASIGRGMTWLRASVKRQTSPEYLRYIAKGIAETGTFPLDLRPTFTLSYMGAVDMPDLGGHVKDVLLYEGEVRKLNVYTFGGEFRFIFHFSDGSLKYAEKVAEILKREGIGAVCGEMVVLPEESDVLSDGAAAETAAGAPETAGTTALPDESEV